MNLENKVKNRFNISEILKKLLFRVSKLEKNSNVPSGNFIPLTGTTEGNPVTGDIEFSESRTIKGVNARLLIEDGIFQFSDDRDPEKYFTISPYYISSSEDLSESDPTDKLIYAQRSYVDKYHKYSTDEIIVGEWLGKPLYRKVYIGFIDTPYEQISLNELDIEHLNIVNQSLTDGVINQNNHQIISNFMLENGVKLFFTSNLGVSYLPDDNTIIINNYYQRLDFSDLSVESDGVMGDYTYTFTIEYTKTTD